MPNNYVTRTTPNGNNPCNLRNNYGTIALEDLTKYKHTYFGQTIRRYQYNRSVFECLMNSVSAYAKKKIIIWSTRFNLGGVYSGVCLLKFIIQYINLDTNTTTSTI